MFFVNHFKYAGIQSSQFKLFFGHIDTERLKKICGEVAYKTTYFNSQQKSIITKVDKSEAIPEFEIEFIREKPISEELSYRLKRWLFNQPTFKKLYQDSNDVSVNDLYVECVFYNPEEIRFADGLHGWKCKCLLSAPVAFQDLTTMTYNNIATSITVNVQSDLNDYIYPVVRITPKTNVDTAHVSITNETDNNRQMLIRDISTANTVIANCSVGTIINGVGKNLYSQLADRKFLRLLPGENVLKTAAVDSLTLEWQNARYIL